MSELSWLELKCQQSHGGHVPVASTPLSLAAALHGCKKQHRRVIKTALDPKGG